MWLREGACHLVAARSQHARERVGRPPAHAVAGDIKLLNSKEPPGRSESCCRISVPWVGCDGIDICGLGPTKD